MSLGVPVLRYVHVCIVGVCCSHLGVRAPSWPVARHSKLTFCRISVEGSLSSAEMTKRASGASVIIPSAPSFPPFIRPSCLKSETRLADHRFLRLLALFEADRASDSTSTFGLLGTPFIAIMLNWRIPLLLLSPLNLQHICTPTNDIQLSLSVRALIALLPLLPPSFVPPSPSDRRQSHVGFCQ